MLNYLYFAGGMILLVKGADFLVTGASSFARRLGVSEIVIGLTIVAFGTSMPEFLVSVVAGATGDTDIVIGNVVGSNICNILLILGVAATIHPLTAQNNTVSREIPFMLLAALVVSVLLNDHSINNASESRLDRGDGLVLVGFFAVFLYYIALAIRGDRQKQPLDEHPTQAIGRSSLETLGGLAGLIVGGRLTVLGATGLATSWGMSEQFIGLTVVAIGTSLPELATSAVAAYRKNADIAIGNIVGSNVFNVFFVLGIPALIQPIPFNPSANIDLIVMNIATFLLLGSMFVGRPARAVQRAEGIVFLLLYAAYIAFVGYRG